MPLEAENAYFAAHKAELLQHHLGQYALIADDRLLGTFTLYQEAYEAGIRELGNRPMLIRPVAADEPLAQMPALVLGLLYANP